MPKFLLQRHCILCDKPSEVLVDRTAYDKYIMGKKLHYPASTHSVQVLFPDLTADEREILISGTHGECYDKAFGGLMPRFYPKYSEEFDRWLIQDTKGSHPFSTILRLTEDQAQRICNILNEEVSNESSTGS